MWRGISLANKCLLLFGGAVVLIVLGAMVAPFLRMNALVDSGQLDISRSLAATWERLEASEPPALARPGETVERGGVRARRLTLAQARDLARNDRFLRVALRELESDASSVDEQGSRWLGKTLEYQYVRAQRGPGGALEGVLLLERRSIQATRLLALNTVYLLGAAMVVLALALLVFYQITHRLILSPVRDLKRTAERVREGDLTIRSSISTGDEFQELAGTFNLMLADLQAGQDQLRAINAALDLKLNELAEANKVLAEAARIKGEFLANVSHELRTPLNSIIGFADLLLELARADAQQPDPPASVGKRIRYCENITNSGRSLLELINDLLDMARLEAGKVEVHPEAMSLRDVCEGLLGLASPLADRRGLELRFEAGEDLPVVRTDVKKFRQIIFNFLSNAVKFTEPEGRAGRPGVVTLRVERLPGGPDGEKVRVSVIDTGPGIPEDQHQAIFEKFHRLETGHTKETGGTGLGLAISKELAQALQGEIQLVSQPGHGAMFSLILPLRYDPDRPGEPRQSTRRTLLVSRAGR